MTDQNITEAELRERRAARQSAVIDLILALGFEPKDVRDIQISGGAIHLHTFVNDGNGNYAMVKDHDGEMVKVQRETVLFYHQADIDAASNLEKFVQGM